MPLRSTVITETKLPIVGFHTGRIGDNFKKVEFGGGQLGRKHKHKDPNLIP